MKKLLILIGYIAIVLAFQGCSKDNTTNSNSIATNCATTNPCHGTSSCPYWYPSEISDEWNYFIDIFGQTTSYRIRVVGDTVINGHTYITNRFVGGTILTNLNAFCWIYGFRDSNGDLYEYDPATDSTWLYLPNNPVINQSWNRQGQLWQVVSLNYSFTTPTCSYTNLLKVKVTDTDGSFSFVCFAKGLGLVAELDQSSTNVSSYLGEVNIH